MTENDPSRSTAALRRAFDEAFAAPPPPERASGEALLLLRVQRTEFAVRISEIGAVSRCPPMTTLPSLNPTVLGLCGRRGGLVVVHSLAQLMGEPRGKLDQHACLLVCAGDASVGLLADELLGHVHVDADAIYPGSALGDWSSAIVNTGGTRCPLASVPLLLAAIREAASTERRSDET